MTPLQQQIVEQLQKTDGNIQAVALRLCVSEEYVRQQAVALEGSKTGPPVPTSLTQELRAALLPQNREGVIALRDCVIGQLQEHLDAGLLPPTTLLRILRLMLEYENQIRAIVRPVAANVLVDQRTANIDLTVLVDKLSGLPHDALRLLAKGVEPQVIDVTPTTNPR